MVGGNFLETGSERYPMFQGLFLDHVQAVPQQALEGDFRDLQIHLPGLDLGEVQNIVDQGKQMPAAPQDIVQVFFLGGVQRPDVPVGHQFGKPDDMV